MDCEFELIQLVYEWTIYTKNSLHCRLFLEIRKNYFMHIDNGKLAFILNDNMENYALSVVSLAGKNKTTFNQCEERKSRTI